MYSPRRSLNTPPPTGTFRRPWSPEPYEPHQQEDDYGYLPQQEDRWRPRSGVRREREPSEVSVEALDLADYRPQQSERAYYPPQDHTRRSFEYGAQGRGASSQRAPSSAYHSAHGSSAHGHLGQEYGRGPPQRRPFSLPPASHNSYDPAHDSWKLHYDSHPDEPGGAPRHPTFSPTRAHHNIEPEMDIGYSHPSMSSRPAYSNPLRSYRDPFQNPSVTSPTHSSASRSKNGEKRSSAGGGGKKFRPTQPVVNPYDDDYGGLPAERAPLSPFDPAYNHDSYKRDSYRHQNGGQYDSYRPSSAYSDPFGGSRAGDFPHDGSRDMLPWTNNGGASAAGGSSSHLDPPSYEEPLDPETKEERMRMLQRAFGEESDAKPGKLDPIGPGQVGSVNERGQLITQGPKKRMATRALQIILSLTAAIPAIYAAAMIKPKRAAPPAGKPAPYVLYVMSIITFLALAGVFMIRPCCCRGKRIKENAHDPLGNRMMVLPVQHGGQNGKKGKKNKHRGPGGKKAKKGRGGPPQGDVQVNLIVDPAMFGGHRREETESEDEEEEEADFDFERAFNGGGTAAKKKKPRAKRRSVFIGLAMEAQWKAARTLLKKLIFFDSVLIIVWGAVFVLILIGPRCPAGGSEGWCNAYNISSAAACALAFTFALSVFFGVKDLSNSKLSPRERP